MEKVGKPVSIILGVALVLFALLALFGLSTKWGDSKIYHIKGIDNFCFGRDLGQNTEVVLKPMSEDFEEKQLGKVTETLKKRLNNLELFDNEISTDIKNKTIRVCFADPSSNNKNFNAGFVCRSLGLKAECSLKKEVDRLKMMQHNVDEASETIVPNECIVDANLIFEKRNRISPPVYGIELILNSEGRAKLREYLEKAKQENENKEEKTMPKNNLEFYLDDGKIVTVRLEEINPSKPIKLFGEPLKKVAVAKQIVGLIKGGCLPTTFFPKNQNQSQRNLSSEVGLDIKGTIFAVLAIAFVATLIFIILKYRAVGLASAIGLVGHLGGAMATLTGFLPIFPGFIVSIPALGGILVGFIVGTSSIMLTANNISKEIKSGKSLDAAIVNGYRQTFRPIKNCIVKILIIAIVLMSMFVIPTSIFKFTLPNISVLGLTPNNGLFMFGYTALIGVLLVALFDILCSKLILRSISKFKIFRNVALYGGSKNAK